MHVLGSQNNNATHHLTCHANVFGTSRRQHFEITVTVSDGLEDKGRNWFLYTRIFFARQCHKFSQTQARSRSFGPQQHQQFYAPTIPMLIVHAPIHFCPAVETRLHKTCLPRRHAAVLLLSALVLLSHLWSWWKQRQYERLGGSKKCWRLAVALILPCCLDNGGKEDTGAAAGSGG